MKWSNICLTAKLYEEYTHREDALRPGLFNIEKVKREWAKTDKNLDLSQKVLHVMREALR